MRCITENANECFNSTVWNLLSKNGFANHLLIKMSVNMAVCQYNGGQLPILQILRDLGVAVSKGMVAQCRQIDNERVHKTKKYKLRVAQRAKQRRAKLDDGEGK